VVLGVLLVFVTLTSADHDPNHPDQHEGCSKDQDCGNDAACNADGTCRCPGQPRKDYVFIRQAKPMCQKVSSIGESCVHRDQCTVRAGNLTQCNSKGKCECYDYEKSGRDVVREYGGTCYRGTTLNEKCSLRNGGDNQCKASIQPEEDVKCVLESGSGTSGTCKCKDGKKCYEKNGATSPGFGVTSVITLALVGLAANKIAS